MAPLLTPVPARWKPSARGAALIWLLVFLAAAALLASNARARTTMRAVCSRYRCTTVAANSGARVVRATRARKGAVSFSATFIEWLASGRTTPLGDEYSVEAVESALTLKRPVLSGPFLAYALVGYGSYNGEGATWKIMRLNARTGRREEARGSRAGGEPGGAISTPCDGGVGEGSPGVTDLIVAPSGALAWIIGALPYQYYSSDPTKLSTYTVCALSAHSRTPEVLDSDSTIAPGSLALAGELVYWTDRGSPHSAPIASAGAGS